MSGDTKKPGDFFSGPTRRATQPGADAGKPDPLRNQTRRIDTPPHRPARPGGDGAGGPDLSSATRVWRPGQDTGEAGSDPDAPAAQTADDFVVGWLVIVDGPGQGNGLPLGYGWNSIGRGEDQRVRVDFGDDEIARDTQCAVAYDGKNRKFFIQHGGGSNLTYVGDAPVLAPQELAADATISMGATTLRFVPFCGDAFDWADLGNGDAPTE